MISDRYLRASWRLHHFDCLTLKQWGSMWFMCTFFFPCLNLPSSKARMLPEAKRMLVQLRSNPPAPTCTQSSSPLLHPAPTSGPSIYFH